MEYVYQVLRESGSKTFHPILSKVLDYVRQGDPADPKVKSEVRAYVLAVAQNEVKESDIKAKLSVINGITTIVIYDSNSILAMGVARQEDTDLAIKEIKERFPGIQIVNA
jgi:uncharacterized protein (UPF0297 family)